ncbi:hypothetical protein [Psychrobacillus sp. FSL H8-0487]|uniref:hypothetical protein n=1 Tax=Psychrobacillus sp. FSL H8-0487 TaxID=2921391 RepID=UPI0030F9FFBB
MIPYTAKKSKIFQELSKDDRNNYFSYSQKKFLHNIDSLYFVVKVKNDWNKDEGVKRLKSVLDFYRNRATKSFDPVVLFQDLGAYEHLGTEFVMHGIGSAPYIYDVSKVDKYLMFFMGHQLNNDTPEIWVQLRSQNLWLTGEHESVKEAINDIKSLLSEFDIEIDNIKENRIDYAYHTNYVQDPTNYFKSENMNRMQKSRFERGSLEFGFKGDFEVETDYITLGRKKSNNIFFRTYNKSKEVIEQQYKQFFIKLWYLENMISYFDLYCMEKAFMKPSRTNYKFLDVARLHFYLEYGLDPDIKNKINKLISKDSIDYDKVVKLADELVPKVTIIMNIEIETKRKFYYSMDSSVDKLLKIKSKDFPKFADKLIVKLDNKQVFHDHLVCNNDEQKGVIRFLDYKAKNKDGLSWTTKDKFPTSDLWKRLQSVKVNKKFDEEKIKLSREYQKTLSTELLKSKLINTMSTYSLYIHGDDVQNDILHDSLDFMSTLNETDMEKAIDYKRKKIALLQNRLGDVEGVSKLENKFKIVDTETGESITSYE